jgi:hypothetical protein
MFYEEKNLSLALKGLPSYESTSCVMQRRVSYCGGRCAIVSTFSDDVWGRFSFRFLECCGIEKALREYVLQGLNVYSMVRDGSAKSGYVREMYQRGNS